MRGGDSSSACVEGELMAELLMRLASQRTQLMPKVVELNRFAVGN